MKRILFLPILFISFACHRVTEKTDRQLTHSKNDIVIDSAAIERYNAESQAEWEEKGRKTWAENYSYLDKILQQVLQQAEAHKRDASYQGYIDTGVYHFKNLQAGFEFGNIFSKDRKHLLVKRYFNPFEGYETYFYTDIYLLLGNRFKKLVADTAEIGFTEDSLVDVNLDGFKDFMISSYSGAGCCPRDARTVYLYNPKTGNFEGEGLFNPEFDNAKKLVYQMDYGYPGELSLDKYRWEGLSLVKIESIYPTHIGLSMDSFVKPYCFTRTTYPGEKTETLKTVPPEYRKLKNYDYFISYQEN